MIPNPCHDKLVKAAGPSFRKKTNRAPIVTRDEKNKFSRLVSRRANKVLSQIDHVPHKNLKAAYEKLFAQFPELPETKRNTMARHDLSESIIECHRLVLLIQAVLVTEGIKEQDRKIGFKQTLTKALENPLEYGSHLKDTLDKVVEELYAIGVPKMDDNDQTLTFQANTRTVHCKPKFVCSTWYQFLVKKIRNAKISKSAHRRLRLAESLKFIPRGRIASKFNTTIPSMRKLKDTLTQPVPRKIDQGKLFRNIDSVVDQVYGRRIHEYKFSQFTQTSPNSTTECTRQVGATAHLLHKYYGPLAFATETMAGVARLKEQFITIYRPSLGILELIEDFYDDLVVNCHSNVSSMPVYGNGKVRPVTKMCPETLILLAPLQSYMFQHIHRHPTFEFTKRPIDAKTGIQKLSKSPYFVSGDYSQATNLFDIEWSKYTLHKIMERFELPLEIQLIAEQSFTQIHIIDQFLGESYDPINGQPMGHPLSFPILCICNAALYLTAFPKKKILKDQPLKINGDDIVFGIEEPSEYTCWKKTIEASGLVLSPGKNFVSSRFLNLNSRTLIRNEHGFLTMANSTLPTLLIDMKERPVTSGSVIPGEPTLRGARVSTKSWKRHGDELWWCLENEVDLGRYNRTVKLFLRHRDLDNTLCPFFSQNVGGLGGPHPPDLTSSKRSSDEFRTSYHISREARGLARVMAKDKIDSCFGANYLPDLDTSTREVKRISSLDHYINSKYPFGARMLVRPFFRAVNKEPIEFNPPERILDGFRQAGKTYGNPVLGIKPHRLNFGLLTDGIPRPPFEPEHQYDTRAPVVAPQKCASLPFSF